MLSMNCELYCPNQQESHWRSLVATTRQVYRGQLTVSQIAGHEQELKWCVELPPLRPAAPLQSAILLPSARCV